MKQLLLTLIFSLLFCSKTISGICIANYVSVSPKGIYVSKNTTFLIDFSESEFSLKNKISDLVFTAVSTKGKSYKLMVLETNFSGTKGQVFLKVKSKLSIGDTISLMVSSISNDTLTIKSRDFLNRINNRKWVVLFKADKEMPIWLSDTISYSLYDSRYTSAPGYSVTFNPKAIDNSKSNNKKTIDEKSKLPLLYLIELDSQKFICSSGGKDPSIYYGICGSNFYFNVDKTYKATIRLIDASGNYSINTKTVLFTTTGEKNEIRVLNKIKAEN